MKNTDFIMAPVGGGGGGDTLEGEVNLLPSKLMLQAGRNDKCKDWSEFGACQSICKTAAIVGRS